MEVNVVASSIPFKGLVYSEALSRVRVPGWNPSSITA